MDNNIQKDKTLNSLVSKSFGELMNHFYRIEYSDQILMIREIVKSTHRIQEERLKCAVEDLEQARERAEEISKEFDAIKELYYQVFHEEVREIGNQSNRIY